ncbi:MAG: lytic transglycosylase domain-containing protein [Clostridia bacterium]|nr:lytic transglycosylase domain-containing protein [Clostridia bacterium]
MTTTMARSRKRRGRRKNRAAGVLACLIAVALIATGAYYIFFYPETIEQIIYPLEYTDIIDRYAREYDLDSARVAAVIYCESSFRPTVVSSAGAVGLMQIMPSTGEWIAEKLDIESYDETMLTDPECNIRFGCWYLNYLDQRFDYDLTKSTAAYHAGGGSVDRWLDDSENSSDGVTLENIPSQVTGQYVSRVAEAYEKYKEIIDA